MGTGDAWVIVPRAERALEGVVIDPPIVGDVFVSPNGDNSTGLDWNTAKHTIAGGISLLNSGETLLIGAGTYTDDFIRDTVPNGLSWGAATIIKGNLGDTVIIDSSFYAPTQRPVYMGSSSYIILDNLQFGPSAPNPAVAPLTYDGVKLDEYSHHIRIQNCTICNNERQGILIAAPSGVLVDSYHEFLGNTFFGNGQFGSNQNHGIYLSHARYCKVWNNTIYDNASYGIQSWYDPDLPGGLATVQYNDIRYNKVFLTAGSGGDRGGIWVTGLDTIVANNIVFGALQDGITLKGDDNVAYHNTIYDSEQYALWSTNSTNILRNNITFTNGFGEVRPGSVGTFSNNLATNPSFVSVSSPADANSDFHIQLGSGAIDYGIDLLSVVPDDFDGIPRDSDPDVGAYEYIGASAIITLDAPAYSGSENSSMSFSILRTQNTTQNIIVLWAITNANAAPVTGDVQFHPGDTSKLVTVTTGEVGPTEVGQVALTSWITLFEPAPIYGTYQTASFTIIDLGADVFVSPNGDNTTGESWITAKHTIADGIALLSPGETLMVGAGTYDQPPGTGIGIFNGVPNGIDVNNYTTIKTDLGATVICRIQSGTFGRFWNDSSGAYIEFDGFVFKGAAMYNALKIEGNGHHIRVRNCEIDGENQSSSGILVSTYTNDIVDHGYNEFLDCVIHNCGASGDSNKTHGIYLTHAHMTVRGCVCYDNQGQGIQAWTPRSPYLTPAFNIIEGNICYGNGQRDIRNRGGGIGGVWENSTIRNNICYGNGSSGVYILGGDNNRIYNNTCFDNDCTSGHAGIAVTGVGSSAQFNVFKNNIVFANVTDTVDLGYNNTFTNNPTVDPSFANAGALDFRITIYSAVKDTGLDLSPDVTDDFDGALRTVPYSCGAYEQDGSPLAVTYFVSKVGDNTTGTSWLTAKRTIADGIALLASGQTLLVGAGTYDEYGLSVPSGSPGNYTTIKTNPGDAVTLFIPGSGEPDPSVRYGFLISNRAYIEIDGFEIDGNNKVSQTNIKLDGGTIATHHVIIRNCVIHGSWGMGILTGGTGSSSNKATNIEVYDCEFYNNGRSDAVAGHGVYFGTYSSNCIAQRCDSHNNSNYGFQTWTADTANHDNIQFIECRAWGNPGGGFTLNAINSAVINCQAWDNGKGIRFGGGTGNVAYHNTTYNNTSGFNLVGTGSLEVRNNIIYANSTAIEETTNPNYTASNNLTIDPSFVNAGVDNFHIQAGSDAIDFGTNLLTYVPLDFDGVNRDSVPDVGAYEFVGAASADIYVSKVGDNTTGTSWLTAKRTIAGGIALLASGQTLLVGAGTYDEYATGSSGLGPDIPNGSAGNYTTIKANPGDTVVVRVLGSGTPAPDVRRCFYLGGKSYVELDGFELDGNNKTAWDCIKIDSGAHHVRIQNCDLHHAFNQGILTGTSTGPPYTSNIEVYDCDIHHCGTSSLAHGIYLGTGTIDSIVSGCNTYSNAGYGLTTWADSAHIAAGSQDNLQWINNRCWDNGSGGITANATNNLFANNICWDNGESGIRVNGGSGNKVFHNTTYSNGLYGFIVPNGTSTCQLRNNIFAFESTPIGGVLGGVTQSNNLITDPSFVSAVTDDFHLLIGSAARDFGTNLLSDVPLDFDGEDRDSAPDVGAYEYI